MSKWQEFWASPLGKGVMAVLRNALIAAAGLAISGLISVISGAELDPTLELVIIAVLKMADELLHKTGVATKGLTRF
jgi:hypothetical protein